MTQTTRIDDALSEVPLVDPSFLLASHTLQPIENTVYLGRDAIRVQALWRTGREVNRDPMFWSSADEYELLVDRNSGVLLRYAAKLRGKEFGIASVNRIIFDELIPNSIFSFTAPSNATVNIVS